MKKVAKAVANNVGRRGAFLLFLTLVFITWSVSFFNTQSTELIKSYYPVLKYIPMNAMAYTTLFGGVICFLGSVIKQVEALSFGFAAMFMTLWSGNYIVSWYTGALPRAYLGLATYLAFAGLVLTISGWPEKFKDEDD